MSAQCRGPQWEANKAPGKDNRSRRFARADEHLVVKSACNVKARLHQRIQTRADGRYEAAALCRYQNAERPDNRKPERLPQTPGRPIIQQRPSGVRLQCKSKRFTLTRSERRPQDYRRDGLAQSLFHDPGWGTKTRRDFAHHGRRDDDDAEDLLQQR